MENHKLVILTTLVVLVLIKFNNFPTMGDTSCFPDFSLTLAAETKVEWPMFVERIVLQATKEGGGGGGRVGGVCRQFATPDCTLSRYART